MIFLTFKLLLIGHRYSVPKAKSAVQTRLSTCFLFPDDNHFHKVVTYNINDKSPGGLCDTECAYNTTLPTGHKAYSAIRRVGLNTWKCKCFAWAMEYGQGLFVFGCFESRSGHKDQLLLVFTKSLRGGQSCDREIDEFTYSAFIYRSHLQSHLTG